MPTVTALYIYPVKSCRGMALPEARVQGQGLQHDREWMLVDENRVFLTQRAEPRMALIETALTADHLVLTAPEAAPLRIPLSGQGNQHQPRLVTARVWKDDCTALDEGEDAAFWFSAFLRRPCRLVRFAPGQRRLSSHDWTGGIDAENRFSDGYPVLVISDESLDELNRRLDEPLPMDRFRPNIVIRGLNRPHGEDDIRTLTQSGFTLQMVKPCDRCRVTTTDQQTAEVGKEPLRTLAQYRRDASLGGVTFGMNAIITQGAGHLLKVGSTMLPGGTGLSP